MNLSNKHLTSRALALAAAAFILLPSIAIAQYDPSSEPACQLTTPAGLSVLVSRPGDSLVQAADLLIEGELSYLCKIEPGMARIVDDTTESELQLRELEMQRPQHEYQQGGQPLFVGAGHRLAGDGSMRWRLFCFVLKPDGSLKLLAEHVTGGFFASELVIADLNNDGLLEIVMPVTGGMGSISGVEGVRLLPDGSFGKMCRGEYSGYSTYYMHMALLDFDGDGSWEIEIKHYIAHAHSGYFVTELTSFDEETGDWVLEPERFPGYYLPQYEFYSRFLPLFEAYAEDPEAFLAELPDAKFMYRAQLDGEWLDLGLLASPEWADDLHSYAEVVAAWVDDLRAITGVQ